MDYIEFIPQIQNYIKKKEKRLQIEQESNVKKDGISVPEDVWNFPNIIYQLLDSTMITSCRRHHGKLESNRLNPH